MLTAVALAVVAFQAWVIYLLAKQHGSTLLAQEALSARLAAAESALTRLQGPVPSAPSAPNSLPGLRTGEAAPDFTLSNLDGRMWSLADFRGHPAVIIFFNPECGFCQQLAPRLGRLPAGAPKTIVISRGERELHRQLVHEHGWRAEVLLEPAWEIATRYRTNATPTAYRIDADGRIASPLAAGIDDVLSLMGSPAQKPADAEDKLRANGLRTRPLSESHLQRNGLRAGTPAPDFTLQDHRGQRWSLRGHLDRGPVVVVFYLGYACNACVHDLFELNADFGRFHRLGAEVVAVSGDTPGLTRQRFEQYGAFGFPVLSDPGRVVARSYGTFRPANGSKPEEFLHGTFLIGRDGQVHWVRCGDTPFRNNQALLYELARLGDKLPQPEPPVPAGDKGAKTP